MSGRTRRRSLRSHDSSPASAARFDDGEGRGRSARRRPAHRRPPNQRGRPGPPGFYVGPHLSSREFPPLSGPFPRLRVVDPSIPSRPAADSSTPKALSLFADASVQPTVPAQTMREDHECDNSELAQSPGSRRSAICRGRSLWHFSDPRRIPDDRWLGLLRPVRRGAPRSSRVDSCRRTGAGACEAYEVRSRTARCGLT
jgi:hypothetical protein